MNKSTELIFYDKEPVLEDHNHKSPSSSREKHPGRDEDKQNATRNGKGKNCDFPEYDPHKKENGHGADAAEQQKKNVRENGAEKYHCCRDYHDAHKKEDGRESDDEHYKQNFSKKNSSCYRDYHDSHKNEENQYHTQNVRDNGRERHYRCRNYDSPGNIRGNGWERHHHCRNYDRSDKEDDGAHGTCSDRKIPKTFFDDDIFNRAFWSRSMPPRDNDTMFENHSDHDYFRSRSCRHDARNSQHWYNSPGTPSCEHCNSTMPPSYGDHHSTSTPHPQEQYGSNMPPPPPLPSPPTSTYYFNFSEENPNGCIVM